MLLKDNLEQIPVGTTGKRCGPTSDKINEKTFCFVL